MFAVAESQLEKSWFFFGAPFGVSLDVGNIIGICWEYVGNIMGISWEYVGNIMGFFMGCTLP
jgi:hypothetical protein